MTTRVAMWSGPRNVSTALMRSFGARADTVVVDEPLYAHYLAATGLDHPGRDEVLASQPTRWQDVAAALTGPLPAGATRVTTRSTWPTTCCRGIGRAWLGAADQRVPDPRPGARRGLLRQGARRADARPISATRSRLEIFRAYGGPVVDAADLLRDPAAVLRAALRRARHRLRPGDAALAAGTAGHRRRLGAALVRRGRGVDRVRALRPGAGRGARHRLRPLVEAAQPYYDELAAHRL